MPTGPEHILMTLSSGPPLAFDGGDMSDTLASVRRAEPDWPALEQRLPPAIVRTIRRCLVKDPRQRTRDIGDLRIQLDETTNGFGPAAPAPATARTSNRLPRLMAFAAIAIAIVAVISV